MISRPTSSIFLGGGVLPRDSSIDSMRPVPTPMALASTRTVEIAGSHCRPTSKSPDPMIEIWPGTSMPRWRHSISAPKAEASETANTASTSGVRSSPRAIAPAPWASETGQRRAAAPNRRRGPSPAADGDVLRCRRVVRPAADTAERMNHRRDR